jgi:hypothetical protein
MKKIIVGCIAVLASVLGATMVLAQTKAAASTPAVSIMDITSVLYSESLPSGGGPIAFTFKIVNLGKVPLNNIVVTDDHCSAMSGELGDINDNHVLDPDETWIYTCTMALAKTTTHRATVTAYANGIRVVAAETATINIPNGSTTSTSRVPGLPNNGTNPNTLNVTAIIWESLGGILVVLIVIYIVIIRKKK